MVASETESANEENKTIEELRDTLRSWDNEIAVGKHEIESLQKQLNELDSEMAKLKNVTSLLLVSQAEVECAKRENEIAAINERIDEQRSIIAENEEREFTLRLESKRLETKHLELEKNREKLKERSEKLLSVSGKLEKLKEVYGQSDTKKLLKVIEKAYKSMVIRLDKEKISIEKAKKRLNKLAENKSFGESENVEKLKEYIIRYHTKNVITGSEYLKRLEEAIRLSHFQSLSMIKQNKLWMTGK